MGTGPEIVGAGVSDLTVRGGRLEPVIATVRSRRLRERRVVLEVTVWPVFLKTLVNSISTSCRPVGCNFTFHIGVAVHWTRGKDCTFFLSIPNEHRHLQIAPIPEEVGWEVNEEIPIDQRTVGVSRGDSIAVGKRERSSIPFLKIIRTQCYKAFQSSIARATRTTNQMLELEVSLFDSVYGA